MKEGWEYKKIKEVGTVIGGSTPNTSNKEYWGGDNCWISPAELDGSHYLYDSKKNITDKAVKEKNLKLLPVGTVILSSRAPIGKVTINKVPTYCNQGFKCVVCGKDLYNEFLYWWFWGHTNYLNSIGKGATFVEISKTVVENIEIPVPPLSEQQRIVSYLDSAFAKIDAVAKNAEDSLNEAKALFQSALTKMMEPKDGWKKKKLGEVLNLRRGHDLTHSQMEDGDIVVAGSNGPIGFHNVATPISPCITIGRSGSVGSVNMYDKCWAHNTTLYIDDFKGNNPKYLYYILTSLNLAKLNSGSAVPTLNRNFIHPISIPFVKDVSKQKAIVATLDSLKSKVDQLQDNLSRTLTECTALKQSILRQTFE